MNNTGLLVVVGVVVVLIVGLGIWFATSPAEAPDGVLSPTPTTVVQLATPAAASRAAETPPDFQPQIFTVTKAPHFVSSEPANNAVVTAAPTSVKINFDFDLATPSKITVTRDGVHVSRGQAAIAADNLSMSVPISAQQTGNYQVNYTSCWPDKSCHDGSFGFSVQLTP